MIVAAVFGYGAEGAATLRLTTAAGGEIPVPNLVVPAGPYAYVVAAQGKNVAEILTAEQ